MFDTDNRKRLQRFLYHRKTYKEVLSLKKKSDLKRLLDYAGGYRYLTIASWVLSVLSALVALLPFVYIWKVIQEILDVSPNLFSMTVLLNSVTS